MSAPDPLGRVAKAAQARTRAVAEWEDAILAAVLARKPLRQIAAAAGVSHPTVVAVAARHGVSVEGQPPGGYRITRRAPESHPPSEGDRTT